MQKSIIALLFICLLTTVAAATESNICESALLFLTSLPPDAPILHSPADETANLPDSIVVIWHSRIHTGLYTLQVADSTDFSNLFVSEMTGDTLFTLSNLDMSTTYYWRVCGNNPAGSSIFSDIWQFSTTPLSSIDMENNLIPKHYALLPIYPNPFNPVTTITYHLPEKADVSLMIYNSMGQSVRELVSANQLAGEYKMIWDGRDNQSASVTSGLYICFFKAGNRVFSQKILLIR